MFRAPYTNISGQLARSVRPSANCPAENTNGNGSILSLPFLIGGPSLLVMRFGIAKARDYYNDDDSNKNFSGDVQAENNDRVGSSFWLSGPSKGLADREAGDRAGRKVAER